MIAEKIIKLADENKVTVFQSPLLARALYFTGEIGKKFLKIYIQLLHLY